MPMLVAEGLTSASDVAFLIQAPPWVSIVMKKLTLCMSHRSTLRTWRSWVCLMHMSSLLSSEKLLRRPANLRRMIAKMVEAKARQQAREKRGSYQTGEVQALPPCGHWHVQTVHTDLRNHR